MSDNHIEALIEEMTADWAAESAESDGNDMAGAYMRLAYAGGYAEGLSERDA